MVQQEQRFDGIWETVRERLGVGLKMIKIHKMVEGGKSSTERQGIDISQFDMYRIICCAI